VPRGWAGGWVGVVVVVVVVGDLVCRPGEVVGVGREGVRGAMARITFLRAGGWCMKFWGCEGCDESG